jgi:hypothetical protein
MAATHTATITEEDSETVVRISGKVNLPAGKVTVREIKATGEIVLTPVRDAAQPDDTWEAFLNDMSRRPIDHEFMKHRPMNHLPGEDTLYSEE